jgi:HK97 family phage prohead protease
MTHKLTLPAVERRFIADSPELRAADNTDFIPMKGYAAKFNKRSQDLGYFVEQLAPGAFTRTIAEDDIILNINHDASKILARNTNGTLRLSEDSVGLVTDADMANTSYAQDLAVLMRRGDINKMSFAFGTLRDHWEELADGTLLRTVLEARLFDVAIVTVPAYEDTEAGLRSLDPLGLAKLEPEQRKELIKQLTGEQPTQSDLDLRRRRLNLKLKFNN